MVVTYLLKTDDWPFSCGQCIETSLNSLLPTRLPTENRVSRRNRLLTTLRLLLTMMLLTLPTVTTSDSMRLSDVFVRATTCLCREGLVLTCVCSCLIDASALRYLCPLYWYTAFRLLMMMRLTLLVVNWSFLMT